MRFTSKSDIENYLKTLQKDKYVVLKAGGYFFCEIYWNEDWKFMFDPFQVLTLKDYSCPRLLISPPDITPFTYDRREDACYVIRQCIWEGCIKALIETKINFGGKELRSNLPGILNDVRSNMGKTIELDGSRNKGVLVGVSSSLEDYYYVIVKANLTLSFESCVGGYKVVNSKEDKLNIPIQTLSKITNDFFSNPFCLDICLLSI